MSTLFSSLDFSIKLLNIAKIEFVFIYDSKNELKKICFLNQLWSRNFIYEAKNQNENLTQLKKIFSFSLT